MATGITINAGPAIFVTNVGKLNWFVSSVLNAEKTSFNKDSGRIERVVFRSRSISSESSWHIEITFPKTLNRPPIISDTLSFAKYCSCADKTTVPTESVKIKSIDKNGNNIEIDFVLTVSSQVVSDWKICGAMIEISCEIPEKYKKEDNNENLKKEQKGLKLPIKALKQPKK